MADALPSMRTVANRLASFQGEHQVAKRRASTQKKKTQSTAAWPHATPAPEDVCYVCQRLYKTHLMIL